MTCYECRQDSILSEGESEATEAVRRHLAECAACQEFVRENQRLRTATRRLAESEQAPPTLRGQVQRMIRVSVPAPSRPKWAWIAAAAAAALLVLGILGVRRYRSGLAVSPNLLAQEFISDHLHYLPGREQIVSSSARDVENWFQGRVDFPVRVPEIPVAGLEDARVCDIAGRKAALLHYRHKPDDTLISLFVAEEPPSFERRKNSVALSTTYKGLNATLWSQRGLVYSLVAPIDEASLKQMAESVRQQEP